MRKTITIALTDLRLFFADRINIVLSTVMPIVMTLVLGGAFTVTGEQALIIDVINQDDSAFATTFLETLQAENPQFVLCSMGEDEDCSLEGDVVLPDEAALEWGLKRVTETYSVALLVIPAGFDAAVTAFEPVALPYYSLADITTGDVVLQSVEAALQEINGAVVASRVADGMADQLTGTAFAAAEARATYRQNTFDLAQTMWAEQPVEVRYVLTAEGEQGADESGVSGFSQSVPGMACMFVLFTVLGGLSLLLEEKQQWTLQRLVVMPITRAHILGGKILARFSTGILQFLIIFAVGLIVGMNFGSDLLGVILIMVAYTLCITALTFAIAPLLKTQMQASGLTTFLSIVLAALGGAWWPLEIVPDFMRVIGHVSPVAWAMDGFTALFFYGGSTADVLLPVGVLLAAAGVLFVLGIRNFRID